MLIHSQKSYEANYKNVRIEIGDFADHKYIYSEGDVYISPSKHEGVGLPVYEAMACGLPVIASNLVAYNSGMKQTFPQLFFEAVDTQKTNRYMDCTICTPNIQRLSDCMKYFLDDPGRVRTLSPLVSQYIEDNYSWHVLYEKYISTFTQVLESKVLSCSQKK